MVKIVDKYPSSYGALLGKGSPIIEKPPESNAERYNRLDALVKKGREDPRFYFSKAPIVYLPPNWIEGEVMWMET